MRLLFFFLICFNLFMMIYKNKREMKISLYEYNKIWIFNQL